MSTQPNRRRRINRPSGTPTPLPGSPWGEEVPAALAGLVDGSGKWFTKRSDTPQSVDDAEATEGRDTRS